MNDARAKFINWAKHLDSDGYFGALTTYDEVIVPLLESLQQLDDEYCKHTDSREGNGRRWCLQCHDWIYPSTEVNPAKMAINAFEEKLKNE